MNISYTPTAWRRCCAPVSLVRCSLEQSVEGNELAFFVTRDVLPVHLLQTQDIGCEAFERGA
jgi:hypothetical protein